MTKPAPKIFLVAAEPSGDHLGAALARELKTQCPEVMLMGIGGPAMVEAGIHSEFDISPLAILGFTEALKAYPVIRKKVKSAADMIMGSSPDAVILIDSWGFMIRVAAALKKRKFAGKIIKYVAPQVWAMRAGRAKILAKYVDHVLSIHSFDAPYFEKQGLDVTFVGNPMFDYSFEPVSRERGDPVRELVVLFGSRPAEIDRLYEPFSETISRILTRYPDIRISSPVSDGVSEMVRARASQDTRLAAVTFVPESEKYALFEKADIALACSGTVTTQLAIMGIPTVVAYKLSPVTALIAGILFKPDYISLINISANKRLMPEFVQLKCTATNLSRSLQSFVDDKTLRLTTSHKLMDQASVMKGKGGPASRRAASAILEIVRET